MNEAAASGTPAPWYAFRGKAYTGSEPAFYAPEKFPWAKETEIVFPEIIGKSAAFLETFEKKADPYFYKSLVSKPGGWQQGAFYFWGRINDTLCREAPELNDFIRSIPGMLSAGLSLLNPQTSILPHYGDTDAVIRCHIGIHIPSGLPGCGIRVNDEARGWEEGKWLMFCDAHRHEAWNHTDLKRLVLIVDVLRPEFASQKRAICSDVLSMMSLQQAEQRFSLLKKFPGKIRGIIRRMYRRKIYRDFKDAY